MHRYHNNHIGTPQELTDDCGNVVWANYEYAWGGTYQSYYKEQSLNDITIKDYELQPIKFQGQSLDIETGLHYNRFRYYDSDVGMFIQRDPIGLLGGWNVFAYAPNPIHWVDVLGLSADVSRAEKYIQKWICNSDSWEQAMIIASSEKMNPDFSVHPMDDDDRTSAEHYIFMRAMVARDSDVPGVVKGIFRTVGPWTSFGYQGAKHYGREFGIYESASPGSYSQLYWENKGYIDGMNPLNNQYEPGKYRCPCTK